MVIKSTSYLLFAISLFVLSSCQQFRTRTDKDRTYPPAQTEERGDQQTTQFPDEPTPPQQPAPAPAAPTQAPRVALIFGPGGARSYGSIGFLQELQKYRVPIKAVGGVEWGSVVGAFYALKGSINDVE
jgi:hypothetical protein